MTRKFSRNHSLSVVLAFFAILTFLLAGGVLAQPSGRGQTTGKSNAVLAAAEASAPAQAGRPLIPRTDGGARPLDGNPLFLPAVSYGTGGDHPNSVAVADVNKDGKPDLLVGNWGSGTVGVLLGNGDGTFQPAVTYGSGGTVESIAVADVNGDGKLDVVVGNDDTNTVGVLLGNGDGTFQSAVAYGSGGPTESVVVADVNGDGKADVVVADFYSQGDGSGEGSVGVLLGNGDGTFQAAVTYQTGGYGALSVKVADVNGDHRPDLLVSNQYAPQGSASGLVSVLLGNGDGSFQPPVTYGSGGRFSYSIAVGEVNGDGKPDLVVSNLCATSDSDCSGATDGQVGVLLGNGDGTYQSAVPYDAGGLYAISVAVGDVNGDGKPDLVVSNANSHAIGVLLGNGDGSFQPAAAYGSGGYSPRSVAMADVNGDGKPDVLVVNFSSDTVGVLLNNTSTSPTTTTLASSANPGGVLRKVTYTATVASQNGGAVTGTVTFQDGGTPVAAIPVTNNQAAYTARYKSVGVHSMTATYSGDANNGGSTSVPLTESILEFTMTVLSTSGSPSKVLQPVTLTATVTSKFGTPPDGELVTFYEWSRVLGSAPLVGGVATYIVAPSQEAEYRMKAVYAGDAVFASSRGGVTQNVRKYDTTTSVSSSQNPSKYGEAVTFTVTVSSAGPTPTGSVSVYQNRKEVAGLALSGGVATFTISSLKAGTHVIYATYWSDDYNHMSRSGYLKQVVVR